MNHPAELKYSKSHEWVKTEDGVVVVGISDYAQDALGDLVFVNLPEVGDSVTAGEAFGDVESVKAVSDLICPVSGTVCAINEELVDSPELLKTDMDTLKSMLGDDVASVYIQQPNFFGCFEDATEIGNTGADTAALPLRMDTDFTAADITKQQKTHHRQNGVVGSQHNEPPTAKQMPPQSLQRNIQQIDAQGNVQRNFRAIDLVGHVAIAEGILVYLLSDGTVSSRKGPDEEYAYHTQGVE